jgi:hypothetical protein
MEETVKTKDINKAYILNLLFPGIGNIYFGQTAIGIMIFIMFLISILLFVAAGSTTLIGIAVIIISILVAIPTAGLALLIGLPVGFLILFLGASSVVIWIFCILVSILLVSRKKDEKISETKST